MENRKEKLVFKGTIFKVYQWRQKMFDGSYSIFERLERPSSVQVIATMNGKIATAFQSQPDRAKFNSLFGGRMEEGETALEAAKRELLEESGMIARKWKLLRQIGSNKNSKIGIGIYLFAAVDCKKVKEQKLDPGERISLKLITAAQLLKWTDDTARIGPYVALYLAEAKYEKSKRAKFFRALGLKGRKGK